MANNDGLIEFGGDEGAPSDLGNNKFERFKAKKGESYQIGFVYWPAGPDGKPNLAAEMPKFLAGKRSYIKGVGYVINKGPEFTALADKKEEPQLKITTVIALWPVKSNGQLDLERLKDGDFKIIPWTFGDTRFASLKALWRKGWPAGQHDIDAECKEEQFQQLEMTPHKDAVLAKLANSEQHQELYKSILARIEACAKRLPKEIGANMSIQDIREKLGISGPVSDNSLDMSNLDTNLDGLL